MKKSILTSSLTAVVVIASYAQIKLLKDINYTAMQTSQTTIELEEPEGFIALGNKVIFRAYDDTHRWQLWVTDNTHEGTYLLKELAPFSAEPTGFTRLNNNIYFAAETENNGRELWKTDGTTAGTVVVADINPGAESGLNFPDFLTELNGVLYFIGDDGTGSALWKSDGTTQGTVKIKSMVFDTSSAGPFRFAKMGNAIYINAYDDEHGNELWKSDGTEAGTVMVKDLVPGPDLGYPRTITRVNNEIFFVAFSGIEGTLNLWKSDGTTEGTVLVKNINSVNLSRPTELISAGGLLFFTADDGVTGRELWRTDGTPAGTYMINKKTSWELKATFPTDVNGTVYFVSGDGNGNELWKTDGTVSGTMLVKDIRTGSLSSSPAGLTAGGNVLYFVADDGVNGEALWKSDGTEAGTTLAKYIGANSGIQNLAFVDGSLYFRADAGNGSKTQLWMYDPALTDAVNLGYRITYEFDYSASGRPYNFIKVNDINYFTADDGVHGVELWKSDGTLSGTSLVKDINAGTADSYFDNLTPADGLLFFTLDDGIHGREVWRTDGTAAGTVMVKDIKPGSASSHPGYFAFHAGMVYFAAEADDVVGTELWKTDGTESGTVMVKDIYPGDYSSAPYNLTSVGNTLYFVASDNIHFIGLGIWKTDGTEGGTVIVDNANSPISSVNYSSDNYYYMRGVNDILYFTASTAEFGEELWKSDGTDEGTVLVKDINVGTGSSRITELIEVNGVLYFQANDGVHGYELWKSDGTEEGTMLVKDINPGGTSSYAGGFATANNLLFFYADDGSGSSYLWRTDGTAEGTFFIESIDPVARVESPAELTSVGNYLFFSTFDPAFSQYHLWRTDGSTCGTIRLSTDYPEGLYIADMTPAGNSILISAEISGSGHGRELYTYDMLGLPPSRCQSIAFDPIPQKTYGDADFILEASASSGLPVQYSSADPTVVSINNNVITILNAGSTTITASQPGDASINAATPVSQLLTVGKASLTATADDKTKFYGDAIPSLTVSYSGFKMTDDASAIDAQPVATTTAEQTSAPGLYTIALTGGSDNNYTITLATGKLEINKVKQTISLLSVADKTEGDQPFTVTATATSGLPVTISSASQKVSIADHTITILAAGNVMISASQTGNEFYEAATAVEEDFCINPATPQLTLTDGGTETPVIASSSTVGNQWFLNSIAIAGENEPSIEVKEAGVYTATVTYDGCTSELSEPLAVVITEVSAEFGNTATVFPNPATNKISIQLNSLGSSAENITIMDLKGITKNVIQVQGRSEIDLDISGYASGAYILLINSKGAVVNKVFIKK